MSAVDAIARFRLRAPLTLVAVALVTWIGLLALGTLRDVLFLGFFAATLAAGLEVPIGLLRRVSPRWLAVPATWLAIVGIAALAAWIVVPTASAQLDTLLAEIPRAISIAEGWWSRATDRGVLHDLFGDASQRGGPGVPNAFAVVRAAVPATFSVAFAAVDVLAVVFLALFISANPRSYVDGFLRLVKKDSEPRIREILAAMGHAMRGWMAGTMVSMTIMGVSVSLVMLALGLDSWLTLGVLAFFGEFVPFLGPIAAFLPAFFMGLAISPSRALWVVVAYIAVQELEAHVVMPLVMRRAIRVRPAVLLLVQLLFGSAFGFLGVLVAAPLVAAVKAALEKGYIEGVLGREPAT